MATRLFSVDGATRLFSVDGATRPFSVDAATRLLSVGAATMILELRSSTLSIQVEELEFHILVEVLKNYRFVIPFGSINGVNTVFLLPFWMDSSRMEVIVNGFSLELSSWSVSGVQLTIVSPLLYPGDMLWVYFWENPP